MDDRSAMLIRRIFFSNLVELESGKIALRCQDGFLKTLLDEDKRKTSTSPFIKLLADGEVIGDFIVLSPKARQMLYDFATLNVEKKEYSASEMQAVHNKKEFAGADFENANYLQRIMQENSFEYLPQLDTNAFMEYLAARQSVPNDSFGNCLKHFIDRAGINQEKLAEIVNMSSNTISRYCNDEYVPPIRTAVAICVALHLLPFDSRHLLRLMGYNLENGPQEYKVFQSILDLFYYSSVEECNKFITKLGYKPLISANKQIKFFIK